jgi:hypothetical protein
LYDFLHSEGQPERKFNDWCNAVANLPRRQTRVLTWPLLTVFGFIAQPRRHIFLKPNVTRPPPTLTASPSGISLARITRPTTACLPSLEPYAATSETSAPAT